MDSPLKAFTFPDGAKHIKGVETQVGEFEYQLADVRGLDHNDLFTLAMWADAALARQEPTVLFLPFLPGARADRGVPFGARIYADFINNHVGPVQIITIDPHSQLALDEWEDLPSAVTVFPFERIIKDKIQRADSDEHQPYVGVIAPDKGAVDRATRAAKVMGVPVYRAEKTRDFETGALNGFHMVDELPAKGKLLIVDDICDGGGTFVGLAEAIGIGYRRLDLWVTHGVFSKGFDELEDHFGTIHTTNSYYGTASYANQSALLAENTIKVYDIVPYFTSEISIA